jgi:ABC-type lipoprotein release transport system permease subunit
VVLVALVALLMSVVATVYPAWRAGNLAIIEALE